VELFGRGKGSAVIWPGMKQVKKVSNFTTVTNGCRKVTN
jgi:hypothetical protein